MFISDTVVNVEHWTIDVNLTSKHEYVEGAGGGCQKLHCGKHSMDRDVTARRLDYPYNREYVRVPHIVKCAPTRPWVLTLKEWRVCCVKPPLFEQGRMRTLVQRHKWEVHCSLEGNSTDCLAGTPHAMLARSAAEPWRGGRKTSYWGNLVGWDGPEDAMLTAAGGQWSGPTMDEGGLKSLRRPWCSIL